MLTIGAKRSTLLLIDFQTRLMPAIDRGDTILANARRLRDAATIMQVPTLFTEQNAEGLGATVPTLAAEGMNLVHKMTFDAVRVPAFLTYVPQDHACVVAGCEAHVCVCQTVLGLIAAKRQVYLVRDALGARRAEDKETAIRRMERHGAEIVTTEMVIFEWMETAEHPQFRKLVSIVK